MRDNNFSASLNFIEKNCFFILIIGLMISGVFIGTFAFCNMNDTVVKSLSFISQSFIETRSSENFLSVILDGFYSSTIQLSIIFLLGFCCISQPITLLFPFVKGLGLGVTLSQIYASIGYKGFFVILFLIVPFCMVTVFSLALAIQESFRMANTLAKMTFTNAISSGAKNETVIYIKKFLMLEAIMIFASLVDAIFTFVFSKILL